MNKRVGRPVKPAPESGRVALSLRVTAPMKAALEEQSTKNGRSLSQEADLRLERTFETQSLLPQVLELAYGTRLAAAMADIGHELRIAEVARYLDEFSVWQREFLADDSNSPAAKAEVEMRVPNTDMMRYMAAVDALLCLHRYFDGRIDLNAAVEDSRQAFLAEPRKKAKPHAR